ncbi:MAG: hypothetical protein F7C33_04565 [Desulfurococcales archaeon]|nr:hypothetical protein [Desulfurococcales archaeon]
MGALAKIVILVLVLLAIGYYADRKGIIDIHGNITVTSQEKLWTNANYSKAAADPDSSQGDKVSLNVYVFNKLNVTKNGHLVTAYEAYLGDSNSLAGDPYNTAKRILYAAPGPQQVGACIHLEGVIRGVATVTTNDGSTINPLYIEASSTSPISCNGV